MTVQYNGLGAVPSRPASKNISSTASSAGLIQVTTSAAHNLMNGDRVQIVGHGVVATAVGKEANGIWTVVVTGATTFTLTGSTYVGNGGATGTVQSLNLAPTEPLLVDGVDALDATNIHAPVEGALDKVSWLGERTGAYRLAAVYTVAGAWAPTVSVPNGSWSTYDTNFDTNVGSVLGYVGVEPGDILEVDFNCAISTAGAGDCIVAVCAEVLEYGIATAHSVANPIAYARFGGNSPLVPAMMHRAYSVGAIGRGKRVYFTFSGYGVGGTPAYSGVGHAHFSVKVWRAN